jgi:hypothetical protein
MRPSGWGKTNVAKNGEGNDVDWTAVLSRAVAYRCLQAEEFKDADLGDRAAFLDALGLPRGDIARMLRTTENSARVMISNKRKRGVKRNGKGK